MRLLLIRTSALGDVAHALPLLPLLRRRMPGIRIAWAVDEAFAPLLAGHPELDCLLPLPLRKVRGRGGGARAVSGLLRSLGKLRSFRAEVALELMGNHKGGVLAWISGARRRIGLAPAARRERGVGAWINEPVAPRRLHAVDRNLDLLEPLLGPVEAAELGPHLLPGERWEGCDRPYLLIHPGAAWGNKRYPSRAWGEVARQLARRTQFAVLVGYGPGEEELARSVVGAAGAGVEALSLPTLPALAAAVRGARLVVGADTGPVHLAQILGRPILMLHGPTDPLRHGVLGPAGRSLALSLPCSFCHRRMDRPRPCLLGIAPERIVAEALELLDGDAPSGRSDRSYRAGEPLQSEVGPGRSTGTRGQGRSEAESERGFG